MRVNKWPENARSEWPDAEIGTQEPPVTEEHLQRFPETGETDVLRGGAVPEAGPTEVLPAVPPPARAPGPHARDPYAHDPYARDPHAQRPLEVTVQLDADRIADERTRLTEHGRASRGGDQDRDRDPSGGPVFVDASGRRRRTFRRLGMFAGIACAVYAVVIVATLLSGSSDAPWLPVPGQNEDKPAGQVDISPAPDDSARPSGRTGAAPGTGPGVAGGAPSPGGSAAASGRGAGTAGQPGASPDPQPTATNPTSGAGSAGGSSPDAAPTAPTPSATSATPTGPAGGSAGPSPSAGGDGGTGTGAGPGGGTGTGTGPGTGNGTGTVADGPVVPDPPAASPTSV